LCKDQDQRKIYQTMCNADYDLFPLCLKPKTNRK